MPLVYLNVANNTSVVFGWFVNITTVAGLIGWIVIEITYLRFFAGLKAQGYSRNGKRPFVMAVHYACQAYTFKQSFHTRFLVNPTYHG